MLELLPRGTGSTTPSRDAEPAWSTTRGFFVKIETVGGRQADRPHLYKSPGVTRAEYLGVPEEIGRVPRRRTTYYLPQSQEEFYFRLQYAAMDLCLVGKEQRHMPCEDVAAAPARPSSRETVSSRYRPESDKTNAVPAPLPGNCGDVPEVLALLER